MKSLFAILLSIGLINGLSAQITVTNTQTPADLVQNVLLGFGVTASNITINGNAANANVLQGNVTYFDAAGTTFPIVNGVLLTTGNGIGAIGPNTEEYHTNNIPATPMVSADVHLNAIANSNVTNGAVLEFDFIPSGDTVSFNYVFGSDEYPEYSPSSFNDAFGFFLWGPGISGPYALAGYPSGGINLALIPGTSTAVTINNLGPGAGQYPQYYVNNQGGAAYGSAIQYDGTTTVLSANASVQCNQTYHIKLAICNVGDQAYDSGVFLQANSFASEAIQVAVATVSGDTTVIEGCSTAELMFIRPQSQIGDTLIVNYEIDGTAIMGTDYNNLPNPVTFLPGEDTVVLTIDPTFDGISDNMEYVTITATTITICGDTIVSSGTLWFIDSVDITINHTDPLVYCISDSVLVTTSASGGEPPYTYSWASGGSGQSSYLSTVTDTTFGSIDYLITVTDNCGYTATDTVTVSLNQTISIDTLIQYPASACVPDGAVSAFVSGLTGVPMYEWTGPGPNSPNSIDATVWQDLYSGWYYFTVSDDVCQTNDSIFVEMLEPPVAEINPVNNSGCNPVEVTFTNGSENTVTYTWDMGNGNVYNLNTEASVTESYSENAMITLIAADANGCTDTAYAYVSVVLCGCMDENAMNYDPTAVQDDGSCVYPQPIVEAPNVFTPNGDLDNDLFELKSIYAVSIELTILNRWGNVIFSANEANPTWNGKTAGGANAEDGTYFYKYVAVGIDGTTIEGHGFFHLFR